MLIPANNRSVAKHKAWFKTYTTWTSTLGTIYGHGTSMPMLGIGTVELTTKASHISDATATIILEDVLHVPEYICNAIGHPLFDGHNVVCVSKDKAKGGIFIHWLGRAARAHQT